MKKKIFIPFLATVLAFGLMLTACGPTSGATATFGVVGQDTHASFLYSVVTVDGDGKATKVEIGEAFGPVGKIVINNGAVSYRNPWYSEIESIADTLEDFRRQLAEGEITSEQMQASIEDTVANKHFISIDGKVFVLTYQNITIKENSAEALVFVSKTDSNVVLTNDYLADNMDWYVTAIKADKVFACDADGTRLNVQFANGALLKNDEKSTYQPTRGLGGAHFKKAMEELSAFAIDKKFEIEYEKVEKGGNWEQLRVKGLTLTVHGETEGVTRPTATDAATFLNYAASYMKAAEAAFERAKAEL